MSNTARPAQKLEETHRDFLKHVQLRSDERAISDARRCARVILLGMADYCKSQAPSYHDGTVSQPGLTTCLEAVRKFRSYLQNLANYIPTWAMEKTPEDCSDDYLKALEKRVNMLTNDFQALQDLRQDIQGHLEEFEGFRKIDKKDPDTRVKYRKIRMKAGVMLENFAKHLTDVAHSISNLPSN